MTRHRSSLGMGYIHPEESNLSEAGAKISLLALLRWKNHMYLVLIF